MLSKQKIDRINELARKSKNKGLSREEKEEQQSLRTEYLTAVRTNLKSSLLNMKIVDPEGTDVTPKKLKEEQYKRNN